MSPVQFTKYFQQPPLSQHLPLKSIDQDNKQVAREARETMHLRINNATLNFNIEKYTS